MSFFNRLISKKTVTSATSGNPAANPHFASASGVDYDPKLIESLESDHAELVALYERIGEAYANGEYAEMRTLLDQFRIRFGAHVISENVRFYNYVERSMVGDRTSIELLRSFRRDMDAIMRDVLSFVRKYQSKTLSREQFSQFAPDYASVLRMLELRINNEESSLYPLYKPMIP